MLLKFSRILLLIAGILFFGRNGYAQFYPAKIYSVSDGLPSNAVYDVTQADNGIMWFVTSKGVTTYDAHSWFVFPDSLNLPYYLNTKIRKGEDGTIWLAGKNKRRHLIAYYSSDDDNNGASWSYLDFPGNWEQDKLTFSFEVKGTPEKFTIYLAGENRLYVYDSENRWKELSVGFSESTHINSLQRYGDIVYLNSSEGQFVIQNDGISESPYQKILGNYHDVLTTSAESDTLYFLGINWLASVHDGEMELLSENIGLTGRANYNRHSMVVDRLGRIFYSSASRVRLFDEETGSSVPLAVNGRANNIFSNKIYLDRENNVWSVDNRGLFKFNLLKFTNYNVDSGLADNEVSAVYESNNGTMYIANSGHLNVYRNEAIVSGTAIPSELYDNPGGVRIMQIAENSRGDLLLAAGSAGLLKYRNGRISLVRGIDFSNINTVISFGGEIYFSEGEALYRISGDGYEKVLDQDFGQFRNMTVLDNETLAILTGNNGLYLWREGDREATNYRSEQLTLNNIYNAIEWRGKIIAATSGGPAVVSGNSLIQFEIPGFEDSVFSLLQDYENKLWLGTFNGIYNWDGTSLNHLTSSQGLIGNEVNRNAFLEDREGNIWVGMELGLSVYDQKNDISEKKVPDLRLTSIMTSAGKVSDAGDTTELKSADNAVNIQFKGISFLHDDRIEYRYRLLNLEDNWIYTNNYSNTSVNYRNLSTGNYTFQVQAKNEVSGWSETESFSFVIKKPWYTQWWVILLGIIGTLALLYIVFRVRYYMLIRRQIKLKMMVDERTERISDQNEQIKAKNDELEKQTRSLNSALNKLEETQVKLLQKEKMAALGVLTAGVAHEINNPVNYIKSASDLINTMLERKNGKIIIDDPEVFDEVFDSIDIGVQRIVGIVQSLGSFSRTNSMDNSACNIHKILRECLIILYHEYKRKVKIIENFTQPDPMVMGNTGQLYQIFTNILINSIQSIEKDGKITIETDFTDDNVIIRISDTGHGISPDHQQKIFDPFFTTKEPGEGTGLGLSIVYNLVEEHGGSIDFDSVEGYGTTVSVKFKAHNLNSTVKEHG